MPARMQATAEDKRTAEDRSTRDYLETTRTFWQPYAERELTREDAREMAHNLPFASSLNGSCTNVCPVKINIHEQICAWRRVLVNQHEVPLVKKTAMKAAGAPLSRPAAYRAAIATADTALRCRFPPEWPKLPPWPPVCN